MSKAINHPVLDGTRDADTLMLSPGDTVMCVNDTDWENIRVGMLLTVKTLSDSHFKVSHPQTGHITVLNTLQNDFIRLDYLKMYSRWANGDTSPHYVCVPWALSEARDDAFIEEELAPAILNLDGLMESLIFRGVSVEAVSREVYARHNSEHSVTDRDLSYDVTRVGRQVTLDYDLLDGLRYPKTSERRIVSDEVLRHVDKKQPG